MCEMESDIPIDSFVDYELSENNIETNTHLRPEYMNYRDVDNLLSCINIWKRETMESPRVSNVEMYKSTSPNPFNNHVSLQNNEPQKFNVVDGFLKLSKLKDDIFNDNAGDAETGVDSMFLNSNEMMYNLNYPVDLTYRSDILSEKFKDDDILSEASSDTRFGTDISDVSNIEAHLNVPANDVINESSAVELSESKGKKIDPETISEHYHVVSYSENLNSSLNSVDYGRLNYENDNLSDLIHVDMPEEVEYKGDIESLISVQPPNGSNQMKVDELNAQINEDDSVLEESIKKEEETQVTFGEGPIINRNVYSEEFENEENPILSMTARENPVITERDILRYGNSDSNLETLASIQAVPKVEEKNVDMVKDISTNCKVEQIMANKETEEPEKIRGVCYCKSDNSWTAWWTEKGKSRKKAFKLSLYGYEEARKRAIEHRLYIEELIPELKEKRTKTNKRKSASSSTQRVYNRTHSGLHSQNLKNNQESNKASILTNDDGIFKGTRNRSREKTENQGIYFRDNTWHATWLDSYGNRIINSFPVTSEVPFLMARSNAIRAYSANAANGMAYNINSNLGSNNYQQSNPNYSKQNYRHLPMYKRTKFNPQNSIDSRVDGLEYFKNLEKKLEEEIEKTKINPSHYYGVQRPTQSTPQNTPNPKIFLQNIQELNISGSEGNSNQNTQSDVEQLKLSPQYCHIKLEKSVLNEIEKAINKSLIGTSNSQQGIDSEGQKDNAEPFTANDDIPINSSGTVENNLQSVDALCISHNTDRNNSVNIIPTYINGPQDTKLLTFVILNS